MNRYFAPDFDVRINGLTLEANVRGSVSDLPVETSVETAGMATFRLHDPNLSFVDSPLFEPNVHRLDPPGVVDPEQPGIM